MDKTESRIGADWLGSVFSTGLDLFELNSLEKVMKIIYTFYQLDLISKEDAQKLGQEYADDLMLKKKEFFKKIKQESHEEEK